PLVGSERAARTNMAFAAAMLMPDAMANCMKSRRETMPRLAAFSAAFSFIANSVMLHLSSEKLATRSDLRPGLAELARRKESRSRVLDDSPRAGNLRGRPLALAPPIWGSGFFNSVSTPDRRTPEPNDFWIPRSRLSLTDK